MISVISFNALGEHAGRVSARCETATLKSEHSRKNVNSFIASLSHFGFIWSKLARSLCDIMQAVTTNAFLGKVRF